MHRKKIKKDKAENIADLLNHYWKAISFGVIFLGYATFSIYMNINGFSYVNPDIKHIVGIGLLLLFPITVIVFLSKSRERSTFLETFAMAGLLVFLFNLPNILDEPYFVLLLFMVLGGMIADIFIENSDSDKKAPTNNFFEKIKLLLLLLLLLLPLSYIFDRTTVYMFAFIFITIDFINNFLYQHFEKKVFNRIVIILFIFFSPFFVAQFIDNHGFKMINFVKKNISIKIDGRESNSTLVYQTENELYLHDANRSFVIKKSGISGDIVFEKYKYESNPLFKFRETISFIKNIFDSNNTY